MMIIGVDFHPEFQQIASVDTETGEFQEKRLAHPAEAEKFYRALVGQKVRVGMEASGHARWFEHLVASRVENRRSGVSLPVAGDWAFAASPQSGLA